MKAVFVFYQLEKSPTSELFGTRSNFSPLRAKLRRIIRTETATNPCRLRITEAHNVNFQLIKSGIKSNECAQGGYLKLRIIKKTVTGGSWVLFRISTIISLSFKH